MLTKLLLKNNAQSMAGGKISKQLGIFLYILILFISSLFFFNITGGLYDTLKPIGQEGFVLGMALASASIIIMMFSISYMLSVFYFAQDTELLLPLPLTSSQILTAKFVTVLIGQYAILFLWLTPILVTYGVMSSASILYYVYGVLVFLALPIIPMLVMSIVLMIIMRFTSISKSKDRSRIIGGIIGVLFAIGINVVIRMQSSASTSIDAIQQMAQEGNNSFVGLVINLFPSSYFGAVSMLESTTLKGLLFLCIFFVLSFVSFLLFVFVGDKLYFKGIMSASGSKKSGKAITSESMEKFTAKTNHLPSYMQKEIRMLFRTPTFLLHCIITPLLTPAIFFVVFFFNDGSFGNIGNLFSGDTDLTFLLPVSFGVLMFMGTFNMAGITIISREGDNWYVNKFLPVPIKTIFYGKVLAAWVIAFGQFLVVAAVLIAVLKPPLILIMLCLVLSFIGVWIHNLVGALVDLHHPMVDWETEQQLFKNRWITLLHFFISVLLFGVTVGVSLSVNLSIWALFGMMVGILILAVVVLKVYVDKKVEAAWEKI